MEVFYGSIISASVAYLINEVNTVQKELKSLREAVISIQIKLGVKKDDDRD